MDSVIEKTSKEEQQIANASISKLSDTSQRIRKSKSSTVKIRVGEKEDYLNIPKRAFSLLFKILNDMAEGKSIAVIPTSKSLSTQQAADLLNISRPHLVKMLEEGKIPFNKAGTHRRIELKDLISYEQKLKKSRKKELNFLARQAQELNLGY